jgi:5-formyltetrahydrofolate cyclo-ligase
VKKKFTIPKAEARKIVLSRRKEITAIEAAEKTEKIKERLSNMDDFVYAQRIFCHISKDKGEVDTRKIINLADGWGKVIFIPKMNKRSKMILRYPFMSWNDLQLNDDGFYEPKMGIDEDMSDVDLIIVPAVAVSTLGQRVGLGGGYYDRLLKKSYAPKYVLAFEFQLFNKIEYNRHDIRIDKIITERRVIDTRTP